MAKKKKEKRDERDEIVEDIESSLAGMTARVNAVERNMFIEPGTLITVHPNGLVEIATGRMLRVPSGGIGVSSGPANDHVSCCCCHP